MIASRSLCNAAIASSDTACPPRQSFVAGDARRRGQACVTKGPKPVAFGAALPTPALRADVDNAQRFSIIVDD